MQHSRDTTLPSGNTRSQHRPLAAFSPTGTNGMYTYLFEDNEFTKDLHLCGLGARIDGDGEMEILWDVSALIAKYKPKAVRTKFIKMAKGADFEEITLPRNMDELKAHKYHKELMAAARKEIDSHLKARTWKLVPRSSIPRGRYTIKSTWASDVKANTMREFLKWKMRLCAQGFRQRPGFDYHHKYSNTVPLEVFRLFLAVCAHADLEVSEADYTTAYLNAYLSEEIWMEQPPGFEVNGPNGEPASEMVCLLLRAIYGLAQSGREWQHTHHTALLKLGWEQCPVEACLFRRWLPQAKCHAFMVTWVDNLFLGFPPKCSERSSCISDIQSVFELTDLGPVSYTLGIQVHQDLSKRVLSISQEQYIATLDAEYSSDFETFKIKIIGGRSSPATEALYDVRTSEPDSDECREWKPRCEAINGKLRFLADFTRVDICAALSWASRHTHRATEDLYVAFLRILFHCIHTKKWRLWYGPGQDTAIREHLVAASDLTIDPWRSCDMFITTDSSHGVRPLLCVYIFFGGTLIAWRICRAGSTTLSACQSEWFAMCLGATMATSLRPVLEFIPSFQIFYPILLFCDSSSAIQLSEKDISARSMKHVAIRLSFLQECVLEHKLILPIKIDGTRNLSDLGTKLLGPQPFHYLREPIIHS